MLSQVNLAAVIWALGVGALIAYAALTPKENDMPATRAELDAALDKLGTRVVNVLEDLKAKVEAGTATPEDFDVEIAKVNALVATVDSDDPDNTNNGDAEPTA